SNAANVTTLDPPDTEAPTSPTNLSASNVTMTSLDLSWTASTDNVGVTGYDVYEGVNLLGSTAGTTFNVTGLSMATLYTFTVVAKDAAGNLSAPSAPLDVTTMSDTIAPSAPTNLTASNTTQTTTDLSWTASTDNVGVTGYDVYEG
ncbi:fibronectin type III domain-containing protein, partial [Aureitalea sp. L0-47]|uniref:fibronectin type III domain-containing protein n=1 Tax=Aureitalea sp. L0-47 TaxID=2816962 RepID=UPI002238BEDA